MAALVGAGRRPLPCGNGAISLSALVLRRGHASAARGRRQFLPRDVLIAGVARTPIGSFCGALSPITAPRLGASAISSALRQARVQPDEVDAVYFGQALPSGCGQNATRQASLAADIPTGVDCTGVNKACASGLKAVMLAAQAVALGIADVAVAGGMENMSQAPYLLRQARTGGYHYGHGALEDSAVSDGMWDAAAQCHLGALVEHMIQNMDISRADQDAFAIESYRRAADAWQRGAMDTIVAPMRVRSTTARDALDSKTVLVSHDEEYVRLRIDTVAKLPPVFSEGGTITAASASSLNDGAAAVVLISSERAAQLGVGTVARILSFSDHAVEPADFAAAPTGAVRRTLQAAGLSSVDFYEVHEAFAATALINMRLLDLDPSRVNVNGGAVALGSPLGASGVNILCSLVNVLQQQDASTGCATIANGGGGACAVAIERV
eukprot:TRINITY_DN39799_c0_g1_i1.p1 TRINITY_DN39799_c0_g1~~TRINITY_DN39799_c0_g1_i1.p1  ORF type:complete len:439 (-),score=55.10 TRINITY_DN39799_c0_g1_i1:24-1340(-)